MQKNKYYKLSLSSEFFHQLPDDLKALTSGVQEYSLSEEEVDAILGERSYCGGNPDESIMQDLDEASSSRDLEIFFDDLEDALLFKHKAQDLLGLQSDIEVSQHDLEDWNESWKEHFQAFEVENAFTVVPSWDTHQYKLKPIKIHPAQAFGTGHHETTYLCLKLLADNIAPLYGDSDLDSGTGHRKVLDFGCGSGILGIAQQLLDERSIADYVDIDPRALENLEFNMNLNSIELDRWNSYLSDEYQTKMKSVSSHYDLIFANILLPVLKDYAEVLIRLLTHSGRLIVSGLLKEQEDEFLETYLKHCVLERKVEKGDWIALCLQLRS